MLRMLFALTLLIHTGFSFGLNLKNIHQVYFFGDSLTDTGYMDNNSKILPTGKKPIYTTPGGHVWAYYLSKKLDVNCSPNNLTPPPNNTTVSGRLNGNDYAAGGARAPANVPGLSMLKGYNPPSFQTQLHNFLMQHHGRAPSGALYFVWIGANDILAPSFFKHSFHTLKSIQNSVVMTASLLKLLRQRGAKHIIVLNIPPVGGTPLFNGSWLSHKLGDFLAKHYNHGLIKQLHKDGVKVDIFDTQFMFNEMVAEIQQEGSYHRGALRLTNDTDSACLPHHYVKTDKPVFALFCLPPKSIHYHEYIFADWVHPTDTVHQLLANKIYAYLQNLKD